MKKLLYSECIFLMRAMGPRVLYPLHLCPILKNLSMQHISGYDLIQGAIGCSVASPLGAAKSGMKRDIHVCVFMYMFKLLSCEFWWLMFIVYAYVRRHNYVFYFAFICLHVFFLCGLHSRGVNIFTNFTFWIWTWYVNILRKRKHGRLERHRPLNMGSQVWNYRATSLGAGTLRRFIIGTYNLKGVITE